MSLLVNGQLKGDWFEAEHEQGEFIRQGSQFRHWVTADGSAGPSGEGGFAAEAGRYHLYVSYACPWAHRTLIFRTLKGLERFIGVDVVHPHMDAAGWEFGGFPGATADSVNGSRFLYENYQRARPDYTGLVTVPVLWDTKRQTIVNNESSEIIRMFNRAFDAWGKAELDLYPSHLRAEIEAVNADIYENINNGVYRTGFATTQSAYEGAYQALFEALDRVEERLSRQRYLVGGQITEADWRLFPTLLRFDAVYVGHFKCNRNRISDFPNLSHYLRDLYQQPGIRETVNMTHIKEHYYWSHTSLNPSRIVPLGPAIDLDAPHDRARLDT
jgi:putative glutathione S-transferase